MRSQSRKDNPQKTEQESGAAAEKNMCSLAGVQHSGYDLKQRAQKATETQNGTCLSKIQMEFFVHLCDYSGKLNVLVFLGDTFPVCLSLSALT